MMISERLFGIAGLGGLGSLVILTHFAPGALPWTMAGVSGAICGGCIRNEYLRDANGRDREARNVGLVFQRLYEQNKGFVAPHQLSIQSDVKLHESEKFLDALAQAQGAQSVKGPQGPGYQFPHPANIIETINSQARAAVQANTEQLVEQNQQLIQQLQVLSSQAAQQQQTTPQDLIAKVARARAHVRKEEVATPTPGMVPDVQNDDAWGGLL